MWVFLTAYMYASCLVYDTTTALSQNKIVYRFYDYFMFYDMFIDTTHYCIIFCLSWFKTKTKSKSQSNLVNNGIDATEVAILSVYKL